MALLARKQDIRRRALSLSQGYPALLAEAERVAAVVASGVHGRRRAGQGETFWQYRNYQSTDEFSFGTMNGKRPIRSISGQTHVPAWCGAAINRSRQKRIAVAS